MSFRTEQGHRPRGEKNPLVQHDEEILEPIAESPLCDDIAPCET